jgi:hypothetical protein
VWPQRGLTAASVYLQSFYVRLICCIIQGKVRWRLCLECISNVVAFSGFLDRVWRIKICNRKQSYMDMLLGRCFVHSMRQHYLQNVYHMSILILLYRLVQSPCVATAS